MFIARLLGDLATGRIMHLGYQITESVDQALLIVLVGILAFQLDYLLRSSGIFLRPATSSPGWRCAPVDVFGSGRIAPRYVFGQGQWVGIALPLLKDRALPLIEWVDYRM